METMSAGANRTRGVVLPKAVGIQTIPSQVPNAAYGHTAAGFGVCPAGFHLF